MSQFCHIAVREKYGVEIVNNLISRKPKLVLDPVFLLSKEQWMEIADSNRIDEPFIFSYTNKPNQLENVLSTTKINLKGVFLYKLTRNLTINDLLEKNVRVKYSMSPTRFLSYVRDAQLIVSASFHCVSLAIIMNKPFIAVLTGNKGKDERLTNILSLLDLNDRIYSKDMSDYQIKQPIDYDKVNSRIDYLKLSSLEYLINTIYD